jgi:hypothetical protein
MQLHLFGPNFARWFRTPLGRFRHSEPSMESCTRQFISPLLLSNSMEVLLPIVQLLKHFSVFYGTKNVITAYTRAFHLFPCRVTSIQSQSVPHSVQLRLVLMSIILNLPAFQQISYIRYEVFTAVTTKNGVFWDVTPCGSCKNRRFGGN